MGAMSAYIIWYMRSRCQIVSEDLTNEEKSLEDYYFQFSLVIGLLSAVFTTIFLSREYSDGTVRNKIIAGHTRINIYISHLAVTFFVSLLMLFVGMVAALTGVTTFGFWKMEAVQLFLYLLIIVMATFTFCAIYTLINVLIQNKALSAILTILVFFTLFF